MRLSGPEVSCLAARETFNAPENRKRKYRPNLNSPPSKRRQQVQALLLQNLTYNQIAQKLEVGKATVHGHIKNLHKQYNVHTTAALAQKLNQQLPPKPIPPKRQAVQDLLLAGQTYKQIAKALNTTFPVVHHHAKNIHRQEKIRSGEKLIPPTPKPPLAQSLKTAQSGD